MNQTAGMTIGLDVACAGFKYRDLFKTMHYVGIDLDQSNLNKGLALRARDTDVGIVADLLQLVHTPAVADVLVSTHTIASLPLEQRVGAVKILADAVMPNGTLFLNMPSKSDNDELEAFLTGHFGIVTRIVYGNGLFMQIEAFFSNRTGNKHSIALALTGCAVIICYLLSFLEDIPMLRKNGAYTLYWCRNRRSEDIETRLSSLKRLSTLKGNA